MLVSHLEAVWVVCVFVHHVIHRRFPDAPARRLLRPAGYRQMKTQPVCILISALLFFAFADSASSIPPAAKVTVVVGSLLRAEGGSKELKSPLDFPFGVDFDNEGNMFIVEMSGARVHRLDKQDRLTVVAGTGRNGYDGDGGPATRATFNDIHNLAIGGPDNDIFISDSSNHCIRRIDQETGRIETLCGTGKAGFDAGFDGIGGPLESAKFNEVICITFNKSAETLLLADINNRRIREINFKANTIHTLAGNGQQGVPVDGSIANKSPLVDPRGVAADSKGNVYVLERAGHSLRVIKPSGKIYTVAGNGKQGFHDGPALHAQFDGPKHLCVDDQDNVYIADDVNHAIRKFDPSSKTVTTVLGHGQGQPAVTLKNPHGVCFHDGKLYVVDSGNNRILSVE